MGKTKRQKSLIKRLKAIFADLPKCEDVEIRRSYYLEDKKIRVPFQGAGVPMQLIVGKQGKCLQLCPEQPLELGASALDDSADDPSYILFDADSYFSRIGGFLRIQGGDKLTLGRKDAQQQALFDYPEQVCDRHFSIKHNYDKFLFRDYVSDSGTCISPLVQDDLVQHIRRWRMDKLRRVRAIYGGPIELLPPNQALALLREVNRGLEQEPYRAPNSQGRPGSVLHLPDDLTPVLMGDTHARVDNLLVVLSQNGFLEGLEAGTAGLVLLGDAVHSELDGEMDRMDSSMLIMDLILRLKLRFPKQVFYIRGNHDSFSEEIAKEGIPQGLLWGRALRNTRGKEYQDEMAEFYRRIPYLVYSKEFVACHAAAPVSKPDLKRLNEAAHEPKLIRELIANRLQRPNRPGGYTKGDIRRLRRCLDLEPDVPFIVGHTPMGREDTLWLDVGGIKHHHILYSAGETWVGVMTWIGGRLVPLRYPVEELLPVINGLTADGDDSVDG